ncbi:575_t:CDS:2 [Entrophospora sp. SA101]|nr:575_t:CDS:2 [Entrophospora sp. SA101]
MSEKKFLYVKGETKDFDTNHENIQVEIEVLNEDIASVFLVDKNDGLENVAFINAKSYFITWINNYELSVLIMLLGLIDDEPKSSHTENGPDDEAQSCIRLGEASLFHLVHHNNREKRIMFMTHNFYMYDLVLQIS